MPKPLFWKSQSWGLEALCSWSCFQDSILAVSYLKKAAVAVRKLVLMNNVAFCELNACLHVSAVMNKTAISQQVYIREDIFTPYYFISSEYLASIMQLNRAGMTYAATTAASLPPTATSLHLR